MPLTAEDMATVNFSNAPLGRRGYAKQEVDDFLHRVVKTFLDQDDLTAAEVHHISFSKPLVGKRGYDERQVHKFLENIEDELSQRTGIRAQPIPESRTEAQARAPRAVDSTISTARIEYFQET